MSLMCCTCVFIWVCDSIPWCIPSVESILAVWPQYELHLCVSFAQYTLLQYVLCQTSLIKQSSAVLVVSCVRGSVHFKGRTLHWPCNTFVWCQIECQSWCICFVTSLFFNGHSFPCIQFITCLTVVLLPRISIRIYIQGSSLDSSLLPFSF